MGTDSVYILMALEEALGVTVSDAEAEKLITPRMAIDLFVTKLDADEEATGVCIMMRGFHRLRRAICSGAGVPRRAVRPEVRLVDLIPRDGRKTRWEAVQQEFGSPPLPGISWLGGIVVSRHTVADVVRSLTCNARVFKLPGERWTRAEIRAVVRACVEEQTGLRDFSDDAEFIRDLGID